MVTLDNDELIDKVASKLSLPRDQVETAVLDLWIGVRRRAADPGNAKCGFRLGKYFRLEFNYFSIRYHMDRFDKGLVVRKINDKRYATQRANDVWRTVMKNIETLRPKYGKIRQKADLKAAMTSTNIESQTQTQHGDHQRQGTSQGDDSGGRGACRSQEEPVLHERV